MSVNGINSEYLKEFLKNSMPEETGKDAHSQTTGSIWVQNGTNQSLPSTFGASIMTIDSEQGTPVDTVEQTQKKSKAEDVGNQTMSVDATNLLEQSKELNKNNKSVQDVMSEACKNGLAFNEAAKKAHEFDMKQVSQTEDLLKQQFEKKPALRDEMQQNFSKLDSDTQKALILDFEKRAKNGEDVNKELNYFLSGLKDSDLLVKSFAHVRLRGHCTPEQLKSFDNKIGYDVTYQQAKDKYESAMTAYTLANSANSQDGEIALKRNINEKSEYQVGNVQILANSSAAKESQEFRNEYNSQMPKLSAAAQPEAVRAALNSSYFTEDDRNNTIGYIKEFKTAEGQKKAALYADSCERLTTKNRQFLASQIQFLNQSVQSSVIRSMAQNQLNTQNKDVMNTLTKEVANLKIDTKAKQEILTAMKESDKVSDATVRQVENILAERSVVEKSDVAPLSQKVIARIELENRIYKATGNKELAQLIASNALGAAPKSLAQFVDLLDKGTITPEFVVSAGYKKSLMTNFTALTKDSQDLVFDMLSAEEVSEMWENGLIPKRFENKVMARLSVNMDTKVANQLARTSNFTELVNFVKAADSAKHQDIFRRAIKDRFSQRAEDDEGLFGGGMLA